MRNEVIFDKSGIPDIMVVFTPDELGLPATLKGRKVSEYLISKYPNTLIGGVPHSLPFQKPAVDVNFDEAVQLCESKGPGWHLLTNDEWAALARQSWENDTMPTGNTASGKSHSHPEQTGTTYDGGYGKTLTGSGPVAWNHDRTAEGVSDMCGNIWEHVGGIRFLNGQVQVIPDNGAAAGADQSADSKEWQAIYTADGDPVYFNPRGGEIFVEPTEAEDKDYDGVRFTDLEAKGLDVPDKLIELGLYPLAGYESDEFFWIDNNAERCVCRGGAWFDGANAGVFFLSGYASRSDSSTTLGFRSALVRYSGGSDTLDNLDEDKTETKQQAAAPFPLPETLPQIVRYALARQLAAIYEKAGGKDVEVFVRKAYEASDEDLQKAAKLAGTLAQVNIATDTMQRAMEQTQLALMTSLTIKEVPDHE